MNTVLKVIAVGLIPLMALALLVGAIGCEDSEVTAPEGSTVTLVADPSNVIIDQDGGETFGESNIIAQVVDGNGQPVDDVPVFFSSSGGKLASRNVCHPALAVCTVTGNACAIETDCPSVTPSVETNQSGIATDILFLRLVEDPDSVEVTVTATTFSQVITVTKSVSTGPVDPVAAIEAVPEDGQRTGFPFTFDGSSSTFDEALVEIECYEWEVLSSLAVFPEFGGGMTNKVVARGKDKSFFDTIIGEPGDETLDLDLTVTLRVSDEPDIICETCGEVEEGELFCDEVADPQQGKFSQFIDSIAYEIRCDLTDPVLQAVGNETVTLTVDGQKECVDGVCKFFPGTTCTVDTVDDDCLFFVSVPVNANASDPEDTILEYVWDCGNNTNQVGQSATCVYTDQTTTTRFASVSVFNDCARSASDDFTVQINEN